MASDATVSAKGDSRQLRLWPPTVVSLLVVAAVALPTMFAPGTYVQMFGMMLGPIIGTVLMVLWWLFFSRKPTVLQRFGGVVFLALAGAATYYTSLESARIGLMVYGTTSVMVAVTVWFLASKGLPWRVQLSGAAVVASALLGLWCMLRSDGVDGAIRPNLAWRWEPTSEDIYIATLSRSSDPARRGEVVADPSMEAAPLRESEGDWTAFRGAQRNSSVRGTAMPTDWTANPLKELWRRPIGPGWSSFAVIGGQVYTQEQRGEEEMVLCLSADDGTEIWAHADAARFSETMAGPGPRATPTFDRGRIYAVGANGLLNCLDARSGNLIWQRNLGDDADARIPEWGFAGSPLVAEDTVYAYAGGGEGKGLIAYDRHSGDLRWTAGNGTHSYSSPHLVSIEGTSQILMLTDHGVFSVDPASGAVLWQHEWAIEFNRVVQPNAWRHHVFLGTGFGRGTRSLAIARDGEAWSVSEDWTSTALKPYYNDFVVHHDHLFGFDGNLFACVDAETGERKWKRGRYGNGQVLLLADQDLLLVLSEKGELVLLRANVEAHEELTHMPAVSGKTWNHPVVAQGRVFVRNGQEAACFQLPTADQL